MAPGRESARTRMEFSSFLRNPDQSTGSSHDLGGEEIRTLPFHLQRSNPLGVLAGELDADNQADGHGSHFGIDTSLPLVTLISCCLCLRT